MTEAELMELAQAVWANYLSTMALFISVISAYLIIAYIAGGRVTRQQVILINILMGVFTGFGVAGMYAFSVTGTEAMMLAIEMSAQRTKIGLTIVPELTLTVFPAIVTSTYSPLKLTSKVSAPLNATLGPAPIDILYKVSWSLGVLSPTTSTPVVSLSHHISQPIPASLPAGERICSLLQVTLSELDFQ